jgi:hypothetical protein
MPYPRDLPDEQWDLLEPEFNAPGKSVREGASSVNVEPPPGW